ncbi:hypothetical protein EJ05DRAFT_214321 [Pseudovirgaria hyperparasitica]|uniref:Uncharacterized protein n=1 Tax=Pseudovirgaria hyperparasitica TaxID=470096 RepID=A0A6A6VT76_9PEZI|nr:uncharacterized protein EJ05DRAFT_214321 [Pseudovirgaria hyperparasitica]KAF2753423.1 hypothetical protein EJ05DRAFT_214321 [Pseudovirgaria hyperparasitica]
MDHGPKRDSWHVLEVTAQHPTRHGIGGREATAASAASAASAAAATQNPDPSFPHVGLFFLTQTSRRPRVFRACQPAHGRLQGGEGVDRRNCSRKKVSCCTGRSGGIHHCPVMAKLSTVPSHVQISLGGAWQNTVNHTRIWTRPWELSRTRSWMDRHWNYAVIRAEILPSWFTDLPPLPFVCGR